MIDTRFTARPVDLSTRASASAPVTTVPDDPSEQFTPGRVQPESVTAAPVVPVTTDDPVPLSQPVPGPFGPLPIESRVPLLLSPVATALGKHWDFLYSRVDPARPTPDPNKVWCDRQREATSGGVDHALARLREKGHEKGTGKVAVLGGGYEVNLAPLLEEFAEVHVVDLSDRPFPVVERQNVNDPNRDRLKFIQTDLSGIDPIYQGVEIERLHGERASGRATSVDGLKAYFGNLPDMVPSSLETGGYTMVVAPVLTEGMPYGALLTDIEARRDQANLEAGIDDSQNRRSTWKHVSGHLSDDFYFDPQVRQGFDRMFLHQSQEINRLLEPGGVGVTSFWTRPDERQSEQAPSESGPLFRLGDNTVTGETFEGFFQPFRHEKIGEAKIYGPEAKPTVHVYSLEKPGP